MLHGRDKSLMPDHSMAEVEDEEQRGKKQSLAMTPWLELSFFSAPWALGPTWSFLFCKLINVYMHITILKCLGSLGNSPVFNS